MTDWPPIALTITTYASDDDAGRERQRAVAQAWRTWRQHLSYRGRLLVHIADDGSELPGYDERWWHQLNTRYRIGTMAYSRQQQGGVGASLNAGWARAIAHYALALYPVDDWQLLWPLDLTPWARLIQAHEDIAAVRLGPPHPGMTGTVEHWEGIWFLRLHRHHFAFSQRPTLFDPAAMVTYYGWHPEGINALECERLYNEGYLTTPGPDIVLALPHPWDHIYTTSLSGLDPHDRGGTV